VLVNRQLGAAGSGQVQNPALGDRGPPGGEPG
jgi:hypothetical protein